MRCCTSSGRSTRSPRSPAGRWLTSSHTARCTTPRSTTRTTHEAVVAAAAEYDPSLAVLGFPDSELLVDAERADLESVPEAFIDRAYRPDGRLVPRSEPGSVITDDEAAVGQAVRFAVDGAVIAVDGEVISSTLVRCASTATRRVRVDRHRRRARRWRRRRRRVRVLRLSGGRPPYGTRALLVSPR